MKQKIKVSHKKPENFLADVEVAATYIHLNGKLLFLENASHKKEAKRWGVPAGKLELNEKPQEGARRELHEETGIDMSLCRFQSLGALYISKPEIAYVYHIFSVRLEEHHPVCLSNEHISFRWVLPVEAKNLPLMDASTEALDAYLHHFTGETHDY